MLPHMVTLAYVMIKYSICKNITNLWINKEYEGPNNAALIECKTNFIQDILLQLIFSNTDESV